MEGFQKKKEKKKRILKKKFWLGQHSLEKNCQERWFFLSRHFKHLHNSLQVFFGQYLHRKSEEFFHKESYVEVSRNKNFQLCKEFFFTLKQYFKVMAIMYKTRLHQTGAGTNPSLAQKATWIIFSFGS